MRHLLSGLVLLAAACGQGSGPPAQEDYAALREARSQAYAKGDRAFYEQLLTDDFVLLGGNGDLIDRAQYLDAEFGAQRPDSLSITTTVSDIEARREGETLVLTYEETETSSVGGQPMTQHSRRLDVYVWQDGRWKLKAMSAARIPEAPTVAPMEAATLASYVGRYEFGAGLVSTVEVDGDHLKEQTTGQQATQLMPMGPDLFFDAGNNSARISFTRDAEGRIVEQVYGAGAQAVRGRKLEEPTDLRQH